MRRYDRSTCNSTISPQPKVASHAIDTVIIEAANRKATALLFALGANMAIFSVQGMRCNSPEGRSRS